LGSQYDYDEYLIKTDSFDHQQNLLIKAIEENHLDLQRGVEIYVRKFNLVDNSSEIEAKAQEILQDTIVTALEKSENYDPKRSALSWLLGIAINHIRHGLRTKVYLNKKVVAVSETAQVEGFIRHPDSSELMSEGDMFDLLYRSTMLPFERPIESAQITDPPPKLEELLNLVTENDRQVLKLAFVENLSSQALAARLGISAGAARTQKHRAIRRLREAYIKSQQKFEEEL
jgi:RNA polymerase sigma factor (sigma-70 family)